MTQRSQIENYIYKKYHAPVEHLWARSPTDGICRHTDNRKWFALFMSVARTTMRVSGDGVVDVLNIKCDPQLMGALLMSSGYRPAYHMSKANWISIILDGTVQTAEIQSLIDLSYKLTAGKVNPHTKNL